MLHGTLSVIGQLQYFLQCFDTVARVINFDPQKPVHMTCNVFRISFTCSATCTYKTNCLCLYENFVMLDCLLSLIAVLGSLIPWYSGVYHFIPTPKNHGIFHMVCHGIFDMGCSDNNNHELGIERVQARNR